MQAAGEAEAQRRHSQRLHRLPINVMTCELVQLQLLMLTQMLMQHCVTQFRTFRTFWTPLLLRWTQMQHQARRHLARLTLAALAHC